MSDRQEARSAAKGSHEDPGEDITEPSEPLDPETVEKLREEHGIELPNWKLPNWKPERSAATAGGAAPRGPSIDGRPLEDRTAAKGSHEDPGEDITEPSEPLDPETVEKLREEHGIELPNWKLPNWKPERSAASPRFPHDSAEECFAADCGTCAPNPPAARTLPPTPGVAAMTAMFAPPIARPPVRCPICYGKTTVPSGFYEDDSTTSALPVKCRSCGGRGIV